jgi:hypothetical protein
MRADDVDAVPTAYATALGCVYIHPLQDGNGRMHRCPIHHVLAEPTFTPPGMVFPVSSAMLDRIDDYRATRRRHSSPLMPFIERRPTSERNVEALNTTADLCRYFDCTEQAEFLYRCVSRTVEQDLPREIDYLRRHDEGILRIMEAVEMPDRIAEDLAMFVRQNTGPLSKNQPEDEFREPTDDEVTRLERIVRAAFDAFDEGAGAPGAAAEGRSDIPKQCRLCRCRHKRHTCASLLLAAGAPIAVAGHGTARVMSGPA